MNLLDMVEKETIKEDNTDFSVGDTIKVHVVIREGNKERIQIFKGDVIARKESGASATFTVRKISFGIGVERVFPLHSRMIKDIEVLRHGKIRRAKLYFLRDRKGKSARLKEAR